VVKARCSFSRRSLEEEMAGYIDSASSLCEDLRGRLCASDRCSVEAAVQDPFVMLSAQGVHKRSPRKISVRDLKVRSLPKLSRKDLWAQSLFSSPGLCKRSLQKRSPVKIS
jgi:hypothetical protein